MSDTGPGLALPAVKIYHYYNKFSQLKWLLFFIPLALALTSYGQQNNGAVAGKVVDSLSQKPLTFATISVFSAEDTSLVTYKLTGDHGDFRIAKLPAGLYLRIIISFSGYAVYRQNFSLKEGEILELGTISLAADIKSLNEVLVTAERPPVIIRNDTIEFNASSFRTLPNALLEDLLKKMPGIEIDRQGNIMVNGRAVNRILIDGKAFFGNNLAMATRNLPADVIDKVQVMDDKEEIERNITGNLTNTGQVINLTLKKSIKKGWFGKLYAGVGTSERYEAGGIASVYRDTLQLSLVGFSNNVNRSSFTFNEVQDIGGFNRSGATTTTVNQRAGIGGFAINGLSFGGTENGISKTTGGGINLNHAPTKNKSFFVQYLGGLLDNTLEERRILNEYLSDTIINSNSFSSTKKSSASHGVSAGANLKLNPLTTLSLRAGYSQLAAQEDGAVMLDITTSKSGNISKGDGIRLNRPDVKAYTHNIFLTRQFSAKGKVLNVSSFLATRKSNQEITTEMFNEYFIPYYQSKQFNQLAANNQQNLLTNFNANFTNAVSEAWSFRVNAFLEYNNEKRSLDFFDKNGSHYNQLNITKSRMTSREQFKINPSISFSWKHKQLMIMGALGGLWQPITNSFGKRHPSQQSTITALLPEILITRKRFSLQYAASVSLPSIGYQIPVADSTNPFQIIYGNTSLRPTKRHSIRFNNSVYQTSSRISYNYFTNLEFLNNDVVLDRIIKSDGVQEIRPVNTDGSLIFNSGAGIGKEYETQDVQINFRIQANVNLEKRKLYVNNSSGNVSTFQIGPSASVGLNWKDLIEFRPMYSVRLTRTHYTNSYFTNLQVLAHILDNELIIRFPKNIVWETNALYRYNSEVAPGIPKSGLYWNAGLTFLMLPKQAGMVRFHVYDMLRSNNGVSRTTSQNQLIDLQTNVLSRYAELSFVYNIRNLAANKKAGGREPLLKL